jgi:putative two-component system response regulator
MTFPDKGRPSILVVDDEELIQNVLIRILERGGYEDVKVASSSHGARLVLNTQPIDLILTDMDMPGESGLDLLTYINKRRPHIATLMITGVNDQSLAERALESGVYGYIIKPFRPNDVLIGVSSALRRRTLELEYRDHREHLETAMKLRTEDLTRALTKLGAAEKSTGAARTETIRRLAIAGEFRDEETGRHVIQMSRYCEMLARAAGVDNALRDSIRDAGSLHDLGKIAIPDSILLKPSSLSAEESAVMQTHAEIGHRMLSGSESPLLDLAAEIALTHHEKIDGTGYPNGLVGDSIPLSGRIAAIADVFDALTTDRVYRAAYSVKEATEIMERDSGRHFDRKLLALFWDLAPAVLAIRAEISRESLAS